MLVVFAVNECRKLWSFRQRHHLSFHIPPQRPSICPALALTHSPQKFTCLLMPFYPVGLLTLLNYGAFMSAADGKPSRAARGDRRRPAPLERHEEELVALYLTLELLWLAEALHKCAGMIHGDIKPDNFRLNDRMPLLDVSELDEEEERQEVVLPLHLLLPVLMVASCFWCYF